MPVIRHTVRNKAGLIFIIVDMSAVTAPNHRPSSIEQGGQPTADVQRVLTSNFYLL